MRLKRVPIVAVSVALLVACCFIALNFKIYTKPRNFSGLKKQVPIGYGWPFVCIQGTIATECYFDQRGGVPCLYFWNHTRNLGVAWIGLLLDTAIGGLIVALVFDAVGWIENRLQLKLGISTLIGLTTFLAFVLIARKPMWDQYIDNPASSYLQNTLVANAFHYAELMVWSAIFVCCLWTPMHPTIHALRFPDEQSRRRLSQRLLSVFQFWTTKN